MTSSFVSAVRGKYLHEVGSQEGGELVGGDKTGKKQALDKLTRVFVPGLGIDGPGPDGEIASVCGAIQELDIGGNKINSWAPVQAIATQLPQLFWLSLDKLSLAPLDAVPDGFLATFGKLRTLCLNDTGMEWSQLLFLAASMPALEEVHFSLNKVSTLQPPAASSTLDVVTSLGGVKSLYLESNALSSWEAITPLAQLPKLTLLNLNYNKLLSVPTYTVGSSGFAVLKHLMLRGNPIDAWSSIDALDGFPALTEARLAELPLTSATSAAVARRTVIARLGKLAALNGSEVRKREREDAERFYLRAVAQEYPEGGLPKDAVIEKGADGKVVDVSDAAPAAAEVDEYGRPVAKAAAAAPAVDEYGRPVAKAAAAAPAVDEYGRPVAKAAAAAPAVDEYGRPIGGAAGGTSGSGGDEGNTIELKVPETAEWAALQTKHPRWAALLVQHGTHASISGGAKASGGVIANELVEVTMRALSAESAHLPAATRKLPGGLPLKSVKLIACQLYKLEPAKVLLLYTPPGQEKEIPEELEDDARSLADLGVVSGGTICIDEKP